MIAALSIPCMAREHNGKRPVCAGGAPVRLEFSLWHGTS
jgi:hypothetical protein